MLLFSPISYSQRSYSNKKPHPVNFQNIPTKFSISMLFYCLIPVQIYISSDSLTTDFIEVMKMIDSFWAMF